MGLVGAAEGTNRGDRDDIEPGRNEPGVISNVGERVDVRPSRGVNDDGVSTVDVMAPLVIGGMEDTTVESKGDTAGGDEGEKGPPGSKPGVV